MRPPTLHLPRLPAERHRQLLSRTRAEPPIPQTTAIGIILRGSNRHAGADLAEELLRHARRLAEVEMDGRVEGPAGLQTAGQRPCVEGMAGALIAVTGVGASVVDADDDGAAEGFAVALVVVVARGEGPAGTALGADAVDVCVAA